MTLHLSAGALGDLDGDGVLDMITLSSSATFVKMNNHMGEEISNEYSQVINSNNPKCIIIRIRLHFVLIIIRLSSLQIYVFKWLNKLIR